jgi:hypothetical protein
MVSEVGAVNEALLRRRIRYSTADNDLVDGGETTTLNCGH